MKLLRENMWNAPQIIMLSKSDTVQVQKTLNLEWNKILNMMDTDQMPKP